MYIFPLSLGAAGTGAVQVPPPRVGSDMEPISVTKWLGTDSVSVPGVPLGLGQALQLN